ncbi:hypothetical protein HHI36_002328 [Cryptolaemus montrouzieri]|uniref:Uncharacterized protein n=1 Tax=Cryptolaemus montrouzieri TaxID=559131 RepID=A0ABD2PB30_9CUCU
MPLLVLEDEDLNILACEIAEEQIEIIDFAINTEQSFKLHLNFDYTNDIILTDDLERTNLNDLKSVEVNVTSNEVENREPLSEVSMNSSYTASDDQEEVFVGDVNDEIPDTEESMEGLLLAGRRKRQKEKQQRLISV